jgi:signal transduction histidine kinase
MRMAFSRQRLTIVVYVCAVSVLALAAIAVDRPDATDLRPDRLLFLFLACIASELLWLPTLTSKGTTSSASMVNFAVLFLLPADQAMWIIGLSVLIATLFFQRKPWYKGIFGFSQIVVTAFLAGHAFDLVAGEALSMASFQQPRALAGAVTAGAVYFFSNTFFVAGAIAISGGEAVRTVWRREYGYGHDISSSAALFALSPLLVLSYLAMGIGGILLFFVPILFIRDADKKYRDLQRTHETLIRTERMAAKGEMAAEIAHELNNYLAALSGRAQLMIMKRGKAAAEPAAEDKGLEMIRDQIQNMAVLTKGLMDFSHKELKKQPIELNDLLRRTVEFVKPQNKYDGIEWDMDFDPSVGTLLLDGGQVQQVLLNLLSNAADAFRDAKTESRRIRIETHRRGKHAEFMVTDNGPGMSPGVLEQIFEPNFTTKVDGHGFGLPTCFRIVESHRGRIHAESAEGKGTTFFVTLPLDDEGKAAKASAA